MNDKLKELLKRKQKIKKNFFKNIYDLDNKIDLIYNFSKSTVNIKNELIFTFDLSNKIFLLDNIIENKLNITKESSIYSNIKEYLVDDFIINNELDIKYSIYIFLLKYYNDYKNFDLNKDLINIRQCKNRFSINNIIIFERNEKYYFYEDTSCFLNKSDINQTYEQLKEYIFHWLYLNDKYNIKHYLKMKYHYN